LPLPDREGALELFARLVAPSCASANSPMRMLVQATGRYAAELVAGGDLELSEDLVQVVLDRSRADEELRAERGVGETVSREPGGLRLLGCELAARLVRASAGGFARSQELSTSALGKRFGAKLAEHLVGCSKVLARVDTAVLPAQPLAVHEVSAGE